MKFLLIGCGSIGKRHLQNLIALKHQVVACDLNKDLIEKDKVKFYLDYKEALDKEEIDAVLICTPPSTHIEIAKFAAEKGKHLFIEKPLSHNLDGLDVLADLIKNKGLVLLVGCNLRFHKAVSIIKGCVDRKEVGKILSIRSYFGHYLPNWRPLQDYSKLYTADSNEGGILLDGIHEIDCVSWLAGDINRVFLSSKKVSDLKINTEDVAELSLEFEKGATGQIHLDYLRHNKHRSLEIIGDKGTILWQSEGKLPEMAKVTMFTQSEKKNILDEEININDMYMEEMKHFINCIKGSETSINNIEQAKKTLSNVLKAKHSKNKGALL